jgi:hypothetical protein
MLALFGTVQLLGGVVSDGIGLFLCRLVRL